MFFYSLAGAMLNAAINTLLCHKLGIPLYLDTVLTITVTINMGLLCGILTGAFTNIILHSLSFWGWEGYLFALCNIATAFMTHLFIRIFPRELKLYIGGTAAKIQAPGPERFTNSSRLGAVMDRVIVLILLSFSLCIAISILGGLITVFIYALRNYPDQNPASMVLSSTMFARDVPVVVREIMSRIPINIIDRLVSAFGAYGLAYLAVTRFKKSYRNLQNQ